MTDRPRRAGRSHRRRAPGGGRPHRGRPCPRRTPGPGAGLAGAAGRPAATALALAAALVLPACGGSERPVVLAGTTTTYDSGLLDALARRFEAGHPGLALKVVAVGTGEALALGRRGDADVLLVHAPEAERAFVEAGHGVSRTPVMRNRFVVVGPPSDPAGVGTTDSAVAAFRAVARTRSTFVSRGDGSGTHRREREIWRAAGIDPAGASWYREVGQGMAETLRWASERGAYTLAVSANVRVLRDQLALRVLLDGGPRLENVYSVVQVADPPHPDAARRLAAWLVGPEARRVVAGFGCGRYGRPLFRPVRPDSAAVGRDSAAVGPAAAAGPPPSGARSDASAGPGGDP